MFFEIGKTRHVQNGGWTTVLHIREPERVSWGTRTGVSCSDVEGDTHRMFCGLAKPNERTTCGGGVRSLAVAQAGGRAVDDEGTMLAVSTELCLDGDKYRTFVL